MQHPDEGTIHAWLDGALTPAEGRAIEEHAASCADCAAAIAEARGLIAGSSRILAALDAVPGGVLPSAETFSALGSERGAPVPSRQWWRSVPLRAAAAIVLVGSVSWLATRSHVQREVTTAASVALPPAEDMAVAAADTTSVASPAPATQAGTVTGVLRGVAVAPERVAQAKPTAQPRGFEVPRPAPAPPSVASRREAANVVAQQSAPVGEGATTGVAEPSPVAPPAGALGSVGGAMADRAAKVASDEQRLVASPMARKSAPMAAMSAPMPARLMPGSEALQRLTGCYWLELMPRPAVPLLPELVELREERADTTDPAAMLVRSVPGEPTFPSSLHASWKTLGENAFEVRVADGARSVTAMLTVAGDSVSGWARTSTGGADDVVSTVRGRRSQCTVPKPDR